MSDVLKTSVEFIKGVGPQRAETLKLDMNIFSFIDLLNHFPFKYVDRSQFQKVNQLVPDNYVQLKGVLLSAEEVGSGKAKRLSVIFKDDTGTLELVWFRGAQWMKKSLQLGKEYIVYGKPSLFNHKFNISHPEMTLYSLGALNELKGLQPVYNSSENMKNKGMDSKGLKKIMAVLLPQLKGKIPETLNAEIITDMQFMSREQAYFQIHQPQNMEMANRAIARLKFDELFFAQLRILKLKQGNQTVFSGFVFDKVGEYFNTFYTKYLPFELTGAQKRVIKEIRKDMGSGKHMNRLLQGDVGSGKTMVAMMSILIALDNGFQAAIMAPTEILAQQHFASFQELLAPLNVQVKLLTGSVKGKERVPLLENLQSGQLQVIVGTHALIEDPVVFKNLGLVIIDEQHRFGVAQRAKLWKKGQVLPHILVMTATPIPRTLAMTVYGDLDVSVIDEMPVGRKPIITVHRQESMRPAIMEFLRTEIAKGRQVYYVFPLIEDSEKLDLNSLMSGFDMVNEYLPPPQFKYSIVHGKLKAKEKESAMNLFKNHQTDILIATTVIEVGVNVPNASVMVIENAERFGLAQLHQLRGRVGRGNEQSYCVLITKPGLSENGYKRISTMVRTNDGFEIAKVDLELRGPGELDGTKQSGVLELKLADIRHDESILIASRVEAQEWLGADELLSKPESEPIRNELKKIPHRTVWSKIS